MKKYLLAILSTLALLHPLSQALGQSANSIIPDVVYGHKDGMALTFDVHRPIEPNGAAVIIVNSGGHRSPMFDLGGTYAKSGRPELDRHLPLLEAGFVIFDLRHGSNPRYSIPEIVVDVQLGVRFIHQNAAFYDVDPEKLGVWGSSAGGHLSLFTALNPEIALADDKGGAETHLVSAVVAMAPLTDLARLMALYPRDGRAGPPGMDFGEEKYADLSPSFFASAGDPPTLLIHGSEDELVPISQSQLMLSALQGVGAEVELLVIEGVGHGLWRRDEIIPATLEWFQRHLLGN